VKEQPPFDPYPLLRSGYIDFENGITDSYEDDSISVVRNADGTVTITEKPIKPVFIYAEDAK
jgi:hypothetical protein